MEEFVLQGGSDYLKIILQDVYGLPESEAPYGGYDTKSVLEIKAGDFLVKSTIYLRTVDISSFYERLVKCNQELSGTIRFTNSPEDNLDIVLEYDKEGHVFIKGSFTSYNGFNNTLEFVIESDQSYMQSTIKQLHALVEKYND